MVTDTVTGASSAGRVESATARLSKSPKMSKSLERTAVAKSGHDDDDSSDGEKHESNDLQKFLYFVCTECQIVHSY